MTNPCRGKCFGVTIFSLKCKLQILSRSKNLGFIKNCHSIKFASASICHSHFGKFFRRTHLVTTLRYLIALQYGISVIGWKILKNKRGGYYIGLFGHYIKNHVQVSNKSIQGGFFCRKKQPYMYLYQIVQSSYDSYIKCIE